MTQLQQLCDLLADGTVWRASRLRSLGIRPQAISDALGAGLISKTSAGFYYRSDAGVTPEIASLVAACERMPLGIGCLLSAAHLSDLADHPPEQPWVALPPGAHKSGARGQQARILRWSYCGAFEAGIVERRIGQAVIRHTGPARTVLDMVRYRRHLGSLDAAAGAARRFLHAGGDLGEVIRLAEALNVPRKTIASLEAFHAALPVP